MKLFHNSPAWKHGGLVLVSVLVTALSTLLFSFLGTISCAALVGMMVGSTRRWNSYVVALSLVFPGVILAYFQLGTSEISSRQSLLLALLCCGVFWVTYLLTFALVWYEGQGEETSSADTAQPVERPINGAAVRLARAHGMAELSPAPALEAAPETGLEELQGIWSRETLDFGGHLCRKILRVDRDSVAWSMVDHHGLSRLVSQGALAIEKLGSYRIVRVLGPSPSAPAGSTRESVRPSSWIYRVNGGTLAIAFNFDETAPEQAPVLETYVRVPALA